MLFNLVKLSSLVRGRRFFQQIIAKMSEELDDMQNLTQKINTISISSETPSRRSAEKRTKPWNKRNLRTGLIYNDFMAKHKCLWTKADECPERYERVRDRFKDYNLIEQCHVLEAEFAREEHVLLAHDKEYYDVVKSTQNEQDVEKLKAISRRYDGIYFNEFTYDCAMMALGSAIKLTHHVIDNNDIKNGFALIRTPGHHAQRGEANGYCYFNNAAIVAKNAIKEKSLKRVLIVDWDVHHGQGTQSFFYDDPQVMYVSIHRYERGKFWPELIESNFNFTGQGKGKGFNLNLPLNEIGCNDADFLLMWFNVILPVAYEYNPELVIISAGFDAALGCPEGKMRLKPTTYHILTHSLMSLADGRVVALLEGGYNLLSLAESAAMTLRALIGFPCPFIDDRFIELENPHTSVVQTILDVIWAIRPQWKFLQLQGKFERFQPEDESLGAGGDVFQRNKYKPIVSYEGPNLNLDNKPESYDLDGVCCPKDEVEQSARNAEIQMIIRETKFDLPNRIFDERTLLMYDDNMMLHKCTTDHPEKPSRYSSIKNRLMELKLLERCTIKNSGLIRKATEDEIALVHDREYIKLMKSTKSLSEKKLLELGNSWDSIYINKFTYDSALLAAGCVLESIDQVMTRQVSNGFALIRPPGHHAFHDEASGFCFFNNVVIGAKYALKKYEQTCKKVLIVDYDFHHGNGVQKLVQDDESILYISIHGYNDANEYPMNTISNFNTGSKNIINIPWNDDRMGDAEYILAYLNILLPCAYEFNPDLVLVSSGFDAAIHDPLGRYRVSPAAYGHFIHHLLPLASGKLIACLEGGYNLKSISDAAANVVSVLLGDPPESLQLKPPSDAAIVSLKNVISYHKSDYKLLCLDYDLPSDQIED